jgi:hypothetical protein
MGGRTNRGGRIDMESFLFFLGWFFSIILVGASIGLGVIVGTWNIKSLIWYIPLAILIISGWLAFYTDRYV